MRYDLTNYDSSLNWYMYPLPLGGVHGVFWVRDSA
jgi:hypothetical protein